MQVIKYPNCGEVFAVDESGYAQIAQQVRDKEFEKELNRREKDLERVKENQLELARVKQEQEFAEQLALKVSELAEKESAIKDLKAQLSGNETEKKLAISEAVSEKEKDDQIAYYKDFKAKQSTKMVGESLEQHCSNQFNSGKALESEWEIETSYRRALEKIGYLLMPEKQ